MGDQTTSADQPSPATIGTIKEIGWAVAMAAADRLGDRRQLDRYEGYWANSGEEGSSNAYITGARHFAEMTLKSFDVAQGRSNEQLTDGHNAPCPRLGDSMAQIDFDTYDHRVRDYAVEVELLALDERAASTGALLAARCCGVIYPRAALHVIHTKARATDDDALAIKVVLLSGNHDVQSLADLLDLDDDEVTDVTCHDQQISWAGNELSLKAKYRKEIALKLKEIDPGS